MPIDVEIKKLIALRTENRLQSIAKTRDLIRTVNPCVPGSSPGRGAIF